MFLPPNIVHFIYSVGWGYVTIVKMKTVKNTERTHCVVMRKVYEIFNSNSVNTSE